MKAMDALISLLAFVALLTFVPKTALSQNMEGTSQRDKEQAITHLNVKVKNLVSLESFCIINDNNPQEFFYDREGNAPFSIPNGFSFVVTDIIVKPDCDRLRLDPDFPTLVVVESPQSVRSFGAQFFGTETKHYALTGGIAYPAGSTPQLRNTTFSGGLVGVQLLGYFIEGTALSPGQPRF